MQIYLVTRNSKGSALFDKDRNVIKNPISIICSGRDEALEKFISSQGVDRLTDVHSWFSNDLVKESLKHVAEGNLEKIKEYVGQNEVSGIILEEMSELRFCTEGLTTYKYYRNDKTRNLAFDGYNLLNAAFYHGHTDVAEYLMTSCRMNPNDTSYGNPIWTSLFPAQLSSTSDYDMEVRKIEMFKNLIKDGEVTKESISSFRSAQAKGSVFHLAVDISDPDLRNNTLKFLANEVPEIASSKNTHGIEGRTPISNLCEKYLERLDDKNSVSEYDFNHEGFKKDLEVLVSCGGFEDFFHSSEYTQLTRRYGQSEHSTFTDAFQRDWEARFFIALSNCLSEHERASYDNPSSAPSLLETTSHTSIASAEESKSRE